jgi:hypothetical protein
MARLGPSLGAQANIFNGFLKFPGQGTATNRRAMITRLATFAAQLAAGVLFLAPDVVWKPPMWATERDMRRRNIVPTVIVERGDGEGQLAKRSRVKTPN